MEMRCTVKYVYSVEGIPNQIKKFVENQFMAARNEAIKLINPRFEEWNKEWGKDIVTDDDLKSYNMFIHNKENEILDHFNKTSWFGPVKLYSDEDADIAGKFKIFGKEYTMHMLIKSE